MAQEDRDLARKRFIVCIDEVQQNFVFGEQFEGRYTKTLTLSDGSTRTIELTPMIHNGMPVVEFKDTGGLTYMGLNGTTTNGRLMVQLRHLDAAQPEWRRDFVPAGFIEGIEILNDNSTPMEFVTLVLSEHLGLTREDSIRRMLEIHTRGGALFATSSFAEAARIAAQISEAAGKGGYPLVCRAIRLEP
jgi:ATP-dependent Clp protease adapter protein ClpS